MNDSFEMQMSCLVVEISKNIAQQLSNKYQLPYEEVIKSLNLPKVISEDNVKKKIIKKNTIPLPFCGKIITNCCHGIRLNHGLYTQCNNEISSHEYDYPVCKTCFKQCQTSEFNKPTYGFIQERIDKGENFLDSKGKKPINYANIMEKLEINIEQARKAAAELGFEIPESQFIIQKKTRGRPKKTIAILDTPSESDCEEPIKKKRGRPKKEKKIITQDNSIDIIEKLKTTVQKECMEKKEIKTIETDEDSDVDTSVECVKIIGKKLIIIQQNDDGSIPKDTQYLYNSSSKQLFTPSLEDYNIIGTWDGSQIIKNNYVNDSD